VRKNKYNKQIAKIDNNLLILVLGLTVIGMIAVADASAPSALREFGDKFYFAKQQLVWGSIGAVAFFVTMLLDYSFWKKIATPLFYLSLVSLLLVFIPGLGGNFLGAKRWVIIGSFTFQPAEAVKLTLILYLAKVADADKRIVSYLFPMGLVAILIMLQPDLGTTVVTLSIGFIQLFIAGVNLLYLFGALLAGSLGGIVLIFTSEYRKDRLMTFLEQTQDPLGKGYHIRQILFALGAGGLFGVGLGQSRQKFLFLPETASDSIFAVIAEEAGFLGALFIIILFLVLVVRMIRIVSFAPDKFSKVLAAGVVAWIGGQAFLNIGSMVAVIPLKGIP
jgi:cell division protein FtsW